MAVLGRRGVAIATLVPLLGAGIAYTLWWISDRLLYIGPFDRAAFGWLVVIPVWMLTPAAAAYTLRPLTGKQAAVAMGTVAVVLGGAIAFLIYQAIAFPDCQFGPVRTPAEWVLPAIVLGAVVGGGFAGTLLAATAVLRAGHRWTSLLVGAASNLALVFVAITVVSLMVGIGTGTCQRSPIG